MNYYEHHIGDYDQATSHLTACEDGIYGRLIRRCYATEKALPADVVAVQRLVRARTKEEKQAVGDMLAEFFTLQADGWHQIRCDQEISRYHEGEPERELKKANESNRVKRHRDERSRLFKALTDAGMHAPWNIGMNELRELVTRTATAPVTPATATQTPVPSTQYPLPSKSTAAALLSKAMRENSIESQPGDPRIIALAEQGVTPETVAAACVELKRQKPGERISPGLVASVITRWAKDATKIQGAQAPSSKTASALMSLEGMKHEPTGIQYGDGERPAEVAGFIAAKHSSG